MKRILVWFWSGGGGGSQFAVRLAHRLSMDFGAGAVRLSLRADDPTIAEAEQRGLSVLRADVASDRRRPLASLTGLAASARVLRDHIVTSQADVVCAAMNFAVAAPLSLTLRKPLIYCAHDPAPHPGDFEPIGQKVTQALLQRRATHVVALSAFAARQLERGGVARGKLRTASLSSVFEPAPQVAPLQNTPARLLLLGRMIAYKGLDLLADALASVAGRSDWRLTVAGEGPALDEAMCARLSRIERVSLRDGFVLEPEMDALIDAHDIVLAPYTSATQSGVVAHALARGRPVIATPVGALGEQLGDGEAGWIASAATPEAFAAALASALDDPRARTVKAQAAHARARAAWTNDQWAWLANA